VAVSFNVDEILSGVASARTFSTDKMIRHKDQMNCVDCGAIAFKPEGHPNTSQYCYSFKLKEDRQKAEISPQQILHQLRENADLQHRTMSGQ